MGNTTGTPMNSVPDRDAPPAAFLSKGFPIEVAVSPDARSRVDPGKRRNVPW